jgi:hypothetical protein
VSTFGTPFEGRDNIIASAVYVTGSLDLRLYTNTKNSLTDATVLADLTYPVGLGYAAYTLSGTWTANNGLVTYSDGSPVYVTFTNTDPADDWTGAVTGAAITDGTYVLHFKDFAADPITLPAGQSIKVDVSTVVS